MSKSKFAQFDPKTEDAMNALMLDMPEVKAGKMFGYPAYKVKGKLAVGLHEKGVVAKVGQQRAQELIGQSGVSAFEPQPGRVWREWVLVAETNPDDYKNHLAIFTEAAKYVTTVS